MSKRITYIDRQQLKMEQHMNRLRDIEESKGILFTLLPCRIAPREFIDIRTGTVWENADSIYQYESIMDIPEGEKPECIKLTICKVTHTYYPKEWLSKYAPNPKKKALLSHIEKSILKDQQRKDARERTESMTDEERDRLIDEAKRVQMERKAAREREREQKQKINNSKT